MANPSWKNVLSIKDLMPPVVAESLTTIQDMYNLLEPSITLITDIVTVLKDLIPYFGTFAAFAIDALLAEFQEYLQNFINSGIYFLAIPPAFGGGEVFLRSFDGSIMNPDDKDRPIFTPSGKMGSLLFTFAAPSLAGVAYIFDAFAAFFSSSSRALAKEMNSKKTQQTAPYTNYYFTELARKNSNLVLKWYSKRILDLIPTNDQDGAVNVIKYINEVLLGIKNLTIQNPLNDYLEIILDQIDQLLQSLNQIQTFINDLNTLINAGPLSVLSIPPDLGGTLAWKTKVDKAMRGGYGGPVYGGSTYVGGIFIAVGGADASAVDLSWTTLMSIYSQAFH